MSAVLVASSNDLHPCIRLDIVAGTSAADAASWTALLAGVTASLPGASAAQVVRIVGVHRVCVEGSATHSCPPAVSRRGSVEAGPSVTVACMSDERASFAMDLGMDVAVAMVHVPAPIACRVDVMVPARVRSFAPVRVDGSRPGSRSAMLSEPASVSTPAARLRRGVLDFFTPSHNGRPIPSDALAAGRIAVAVTAQPGVPVDADLLDNWTTRLLHLLNQRWTGAACACCG